jgi:L-lactate dehydrogenase complex protein LldE
MAPADQPPSRVALFVTCFNDTLFPRVGQATVTLLERLGVAVDFPLDQTCCGQLHFNSGHRSQCLPLVDRFAEVFGDWPAVVTPSASCAAMVRHQHPVLRPGRTPPPVYELSEFLVDVLGVTGVGASFPHRVAWHATCHSQRSLRIGDRPARLLAEVRGLELVPLSAPEQCCGFGGTFSVKNPDTSVAMGDDKADDVLATGAEVLAAADTSCLMHVGGLLSRRGAPVRPVHLAEILAATEPAP